METRLIVAYLLILLMGIAIAWMVTAYTRKRRHERRMRYGYRPRTPLRSGRAPRH